MRLADCAAVAEIRVRGWQRAYAGLIPRAYLDAMDVIRDAERRRSYERAGFRPDGSEETFEAGGAQVPEVGYVRALTPPPAG